MGAVLLGSCLAFSWARQSEVNTLRALGFVRSDLLGFFALEAWILSLLSAVCGALLGTWEDILSPSRPGESATEKKRKEEKRREVSGVEEKMMKEEKR